MNDLFGKPLALVVGLALVSLLPFVFMSLTSFVKISTVFQILKSALGAPSVPSNTVIMALSASLTVLAMAPVGTQIAHRASPLLSEKSDTSKVIREGWTAISVPLLGFLSSNASELEKGRFLALATKAHTRSMESLQTSIDEGDLQHEEEIDKDEKTGKGAKKQTSPRRPLKIDPPTAKDFTVLAPAFVVTELGEAFRIGVMIYLPFLVLDLVIANVLLALGMQMLSPTQISLPFKLLLFVAVGGWGLLAEALVSSYR